MKYLMWLLLFPIFVLAKPIPVIIDTDMAIDDMQAIVYLLGQPEVDIRAIAFTPTGEATCENSLHNMRGILSFFPGRQIPVACGPSKTMSPLEHRFPEVWTKSANLHYFPNTHTNQLIVYPNAVDLLKDTLKQAHEPVTILAIAPLTNLGLLLNKDKSIQSSIKQVFVTGGNLKEVKKSWNLYIDPMAANILLNSHIPIIFVPPEARIQVDRIIPTLIPPLEEHLTPKNQFIVRLLKTPDPIVGDGLTGILLLHPDICQFYPHTVTLNLSTGATDLTPNGIKTQFCEKVDVPRFKELYLSGV